ncbi:MAG: methyltransferase domain-containing protein [Verrucomicrobiota bacterium]|nr:methyltransferase domain-containing protein [Verrucomicrobiota bacterium]
MKRAFDPADPEWMDRPQPVSAELLSDLHNLRTLNRYFGSYRLVRYFLRRWLRPGDRLRILDLATGSGDIPRLVVDFARKVGAEVQIDAVDFQASTIAIARELSADYPEIRFHCADIHSFGDEQAYDIVFFSLALHHFSEDDAIALLRRCRALSRGKILVADLCRGWFAKVGVDLITATIFREEMTRNDARVSVERAFSFEEFGQLARAAGWEDFGQRRFRFARQAIWLERAASDRDPR